MRVLATVGMAVLASAAMAGEVVLDVDAGSLKGSATLVNKILPNGSKYVRLGMLLKDGAGKEVSVLQESTYDKEGKPVRMLQRTSMKGGQALQSIVATFDEAGANIQIDQAGKTVSNKVAFPAGKKVAALPEFWFVRDTVANGGVSTYSRFDLATQGWTELTCKYAGTREINWGNALVRSHLVTMGETKAYLDDQGDPYIIESPGARMVRRKK